MRHATVFTVDDCIAFNIINTRNALKRASDRYDRPESAQRLRDFARKDMKAAVEWLIFKIDLVMVYALQITPTCHSTGNPDA